MNTPICDFVRAYAAGNPVRMHMPGHKGKPLLGPETLDITEIDGADILYRSRSIIRESEENAAGLFGTGRTVYSTEGSSLCIRAMLYLALLNAKGKGIAPRLLAGRNAHRTLMTAAALLDLEIDWIMPEPGEGLLSCTVTAEKLEKALEQQKYMAVYLTSPDYLGRMADIRTAAEVCHRHGVPLLADNAHGAYLRFFPDMHPISLGADACCDSAHKTLSCLTGAAYLHLSQNAPSNWAGQAERAMDLFASTSPSWLILQSLDRMNRELSGDYPDRVRRAAERAGEIRRTLEKDGWQFTGEEPMKLAIRASSKGYTGEELMKVLRENGIECEFFDREYVVLMPSAETTGGEWERLAEALRGAGKGSCRSAVPEIPPAFVPERVMSIREAMLAPRETLPVSKATGRILADACVSCPPAVPVVTAGERITKEAAACMQYCGIHQCDVVSVSGK